jgi:hypothetical protein
LQAGGRRFESDRLHQHAAGYADRSGRIGNAGSGGFDDVEAGGSVASGRRARSGWFVVFVRVNQVLVRLWALLRRDV